MISRGPEVEDEIQKSCRQAPKQRIAYPDQTQNDSGGNAKPHIDQRYGREIAGDRAVGLVEPVGVKPCGLVKTVPGQNKEKERTQKNQDLRSEIWRKPQCVHHGRKGGACGGFVLAAHGFFDLAANGFNAADEIRKRRKPDLHLAFDSGQLFGHQAQKRLKQQEGDDDQCTGQQQEPHGRDEAGTAQLPHEMPVGSSALISTRGGGHRNKISSYEFKRVAPSQARQMLTEPFQSSATSLQPHARKLKPPVGCKPKRLGSRSRVTNGRLT